jgi:hypothetical protein
VASHDLQEPLRKIQAFGTGCERNTVRRWTTKRRTICTGCRTPPAECTG